MSISVEIHKKLDAFNLDVSFCSASRRIGILGASGCGKSMTLKRREEHDAQEYCRDRDSR